MQPSRRSRFLRMLGCFPRPPTVLRMDVTVTPDCADPEYVDVCATLTSIPRAYSSVGARVRSRGGEVDLTLFVVDLAGEETEVTTVPVPIRYADVDRATLVLNKKDTVDLDHVADGVSVSRVKMNPTRATVRIPVRPRQRSPAAQLLVSAV